MKKLFLLLVAVLLLALLYWLGGIIFDDIKHLIQRLGTFLGNELFATFLLFVGYLAGLMLIHFCSRLRILSKGWGSFAVTAALLTYLLPLLAIMVRLVFSFDVPVCDYGSGRYCE